MSTATPTEPVSAERRASGGWERRHPARRDSPSTTEDGQPKQHRGHHSASPKRPPRSGRRLGPILGSCTRTAGLCWHQPLRSLSARHVLRWVSAVLESTRLPHPLASVSSEVLIPWSPSGHGWKVAAAPELSPPHAAAMPKGSAWAVISASKPRTVFTPLVTALQLKAFMCCSLLVKAPASVRDASGLLLTQTHAFLYGKTFYKWKWSL